MKSLMKFVIVPAVLVAASFAATPSTAKAHGWGYGYGYSYRPVYHSYYVPTYYAPSYHYTPVYGYGHWCY